MAGGKSVAGSDMQGSSRGLVPQSQCKGQVHFQWLGDSSAPVPYGGRHLQRSTGWDRQALSPNPFEEICS